LFWVFVVYGSTYSAGLAAGRSNLLRTLAGSASILPWRWLSPPWAPPPPSSDAVAAEPILLWLVSSCPGTAAGLHFRPPRFDSDAAALAVAAGVGLQALTRLTAGRDR
jgi:hypothetical protein